MKRLAIITTHPIQYNAPLFSLLARRRNISIKVFYTWGKAVLNNKYDPGFGKTIEWDLPLLEGYEYEFVENVSKDAGSHHFKGIINPNLILTIQNWGADAILVYGWSFRSHLKALRYFYKKIPVFFRGDSTLLSQTNGLKSYARKIFLKWVYSHVDVALYVGTYNKAYFGNAGLTANQLVFAPHAVDNEWFQERASSLKEEAVSLRKRLGINVSDILFLYAGKLDANKNTGLLLEIFLRANAQNAHLLIVGNGALEDRLKVRFEKEGRIHFLPFQNQQQMPMIYTAADVFVLPSINETWGLGINEAMACSRAVLASEGCGAAIDLVKPGVNGYIFKNDDANDFEEKIKLLMARHGQLEEYGIASHKIISKWSFQKISEAIENALQ